MIVEIIGYGGGDDDGENPESGQRHRRTQNSGYNSASSVQIVGAGVPSDQQKMRLIEDGKL